jgi:transposase
MEVLFPRCAGIDVHKRTVVACRIVLTDDGEWLRETRTYGTTTADLLRLSDWLPAGGCTHVGLESTGEFWKPVFNLLEGSFEVWLLSAQRVRAVPGRKTDVRDAEWIAELLRHGLVEPSFIPPRHQRELRELARQRTNFVRGRATLVNRVQKVLESTNLKLTAVVSNVAGVSGRALLAALLDGEEDVALLADLAKGKLRKKRDELERALSGRLAPHHRFLLTELLAQIDGLDETIARFDAEIARRCAVNEEDAVVALLDTIPGIGRAMGELLVAEIGVDMTKFPTPAHLAAWAGVAPGSNESAGRQRSGRTRKGNAWLKTALVQAAHGAARMKGTALAAQYRRVAARRGAKRAIMAVAHRLLVIAYHVIARREPYHELGADYLERRRPVAVVDRLVQRLRQLGVEVTVTADAPGGVPPAGAVLAATP